jgi:hypothetical protein
VRVLLAAGASLSIGVVAAALALARADTPLALLPGWGVALAAVLFLAVLQGIAFILLFAFTVLSNRKSAAVILARDYEYFVNEVTRVFPPLR